MVALEIILQLIVVDNKINKNIQALKVVLERVDQSAETILGVEVKYEVFVFLAENALQLSCLVGFNLMLAVTRHFTFITLSRLSSCCITEGLWNLALNSAEKEVNEFFSFKSFCVGHNSSDSCSKLLVLLVLIDQSLTVLLVWKQKLGHS